VIRQLAPGRLGVAPLTPYAGLMDYVRGEIAFSQVFQVEKREKRGEKRGRFRIFSSVLQPKI
jgi:hypothetical protein